MSFLSIECDNSSEEFILDAMTQVISELYPFSPSEEKFNND